MPHVRPVAHKNKGVISLQRIKNLGFVQRINVSDVAVSGL